MKLVIDIPDETYKEIKWRGLFLCPRDSEALVNSIKNGIPYEDRPHGEWKIREKSKSDRKGEEK